MFVLQNKCLSCALDILCPSLMACVRLMHVRAVRFKLGSQRFSFCLLSSLSSLLSRLSSVFCLLSSLFSLQSLFSLLSLLSSLFSLLSSLFSLLRSLFSVLCSLFSLLSTQEGAKRSRGLCKGGSSVHRRGLYTGGDYTQ